MINGSVNKMLSFYGDKEVCKSPLVFTQGCSANEKVSGHAGDHLSLKRSKKETKSSDLRRKILTKKVLKQARFTYKSRQLSTAPNSLITQLDNLSLKSEHAYVMLPLPHDTSSAKAAANKINLKAENTSSASSTSDISDSADCCGMFKTLNLTSDKDMPSFKTVTQDCSNTNPNGVLPSPEEQKNKKQLMNKKTFPRRRKLRISANNTESSNVNRVVTSPHIGTTSCAHEVHLSETNAAICEIAAYMENYFVLPKKMSSMAEMMYT